MGGMLHERKEIFTEYYCVFTFLKLCVYERERERERERENPVYVYGSVSQSVNWVEG